jgi:hypothetical protein
MKTRKSGRAHASIIAYTLLAAVSLTLAACADESDANPPQAPVEESTGVSAICRDVAETRKSMENAVTAVTRLDEVGLDQATREARSDLDSLAESARESGQAAQVEKLNQSVVEFQRLLAQPDLSWSDSVISAQIRQVSNDLAAIENTAGCPA